MARLHAGVVFCSERLRAGDGVRLARFARDEATPEWRLHVERAYRCALAKVFHPFHSRPMEVRHLLGASLGAVPGLAQPVWSDWVLVRNPRLRTASLHLCLDFGATALDIEDAACPRVEAAAAFLSRIYGLSERPLNLTPLLAEASRLFGELSGGRRNALGISRYMVVSVCSDDPAHVVAPSPAARVNFYRLLFQHARGVDAHTAEAMLPAPWRSTAFFQLYSQPGGILSVSVPYPEDRAADAAWFEPRPPRLAAPPAGMEVDDAREPRGPSSGGRYSSYDLLPEYPPLRYLALPAAEFAAAHEETLRGVHEAAFGRLGAWRRLPWQPRPEVLHLLAANLEGVRLPIVRDLLDRLLDRQLQARTASAAMDRLRMRENRRAAVLAVAGLLLTLVFADYRKSLDTFRELAPAPSPPAGAGASAAGRPPPGGDAAPR